MTLLLVIGAGFIIVDVAVELVCAYLRDREDRDELASRARIRRELQGK